jgi:hypothetical protein
VGDVDLGFFNRELTVRPQVDGRLLGPQVQQVVVGVFVSLHIDEVSSAGRDELGPDWNLVGIAVRDCGQGLA